MDRVSHVTAVDIGSGRMGFRSKDTVAGLAGTVVPAAYLNMLQEELLAVVEKSGRTPDDDLWTQLSDSIRSQAMNYRSATGTNALAITLDPAPASWAALVGVPLRVVAPGPNTAANPTLQPAGLTAKTMGWGDGAQIEPGAWTAGQILTVIYDGVIVRVVAGADPYQITTALTKTVYGAAPDFATLTEAYDWLSRRRITQTGSVKLELRAGQHIKNSAGNSLNFLHPDGARISIEGAALTAAYPANAAFAATGFSSVTRAANTATNLTLLRGVFATELRFTGGAGCAFLGSLGSIKNILFTGDGSAADGPQFINGDGSIDAVVAVGFGSRGVVISGGGGWGVSKVSGVGNAGVGVFIDGTTIGLTGPLGGYGNGSHGVSIGSKSAVSNSGGNINGNGNAGNGVLCDSSMAICGAASTANNNGAHGFQGISAIRLDAKSCTASANTAGVGFLASEGSFVDAQNSGGTGNSAGYIASDGSRLKVAGGGANGTIQYSPALNTIGNGNSIIIG